MENLRRLWKSKKGELYVEQMVSILLIIAVSVGIASVLFVLQKKKTLDNMAIELTRCIQINGKVTPEFDRMYNVLTENMDITEKPSYAIETDYIPRTGNVQLGTTITLRLEQQANVFKLFDIPIKSRGVGNSEVYFKTD